MTYSQIAFCSDFFEGRLCLLVAAFLEEEYTSRVFTEFRQFDSLLLPKIPLSQLYQGTQRRFGDVPERNLIYTNSLINQRTACRTRVFALRKIPFERGLSPGVT